jgi:hypothetical protein
VPLAEFEPAIPATKLPQTYALDRADTGIGIKTITLILNKLYLVLIQKNIPGGGKGFFL